jgi:hypothetical protein
MTTNKNIDNLIISLTDWRGPMLGRLRQLIHEADPEVVEEWKFMGAPCWYHDGMMIVGNAFKTSIKLGFLYGASLPDPDKLFNTELAGNQRRGIKYFEGDAINEEALITLIRAAIAHNQAKKK